MISDSFSCAAIFASFIVCIRDQLSVSEDRLNHCEDVAQESDIHGSSATPWYSTAVFQKQVPTMSKSPKRKRVGT